MSALLNLAGSPGEISPLSLALLSEAQQQNRFLGIPWWVWLLVILLVVFFGVIWTLYEEGEFGKKDKLPVAAAPESAEAVAEMAEPPPAVEAEPAPPVEAEPVPPPPTEPSPPPPKPRPDNLKRVKGIGPKIEQLLNEKGITTFAQLAETEVSRLEAWLDEADWEFADPSTWPEQARELAGGSGSS